MGVRTIGIPPTFQDEASTALLPSPSLASAPAHLFTAITDFFPSAAPAPVSTSFITSQEIEEGSNRAALAFKILAPVAGVILLVVFCYLWGPRGKEWRERGRHARAIAEQQQRARNARAAAFTATFPAAASGMEPEVQPVTRPRVMRQQSSTSLPPYEREAADDEVVLGFGDAVDGVCAAELERRTESIVTLTPVPEYAFTTPSAHGSSTSPPTPTTPTGSSSAGATSSRAAPATGISATGRCAPGPPTPTGPPAYRRTWSSTSLPRPLSA
ncbi:hypothetical protein CspeluHIS016_0111730 [Cutaneotrichosporon spelunceum]|uniref:Uncharacterized protein n=1 Tax=Cutaneotrichosporon spelunceum TaxID=1672016 RepID=A0AAD3TPU3_9TREE|nr:hypothetical protein CspeluHIS016_0111730 [Cutaneotrichosporon spelunceum]